MDMKEICRRYIEAFGSYITDSFYDDEGGDYVELDIYNQNNKSMSIEIEIDSSYFGFVCHNYDEMYNYDENTEEYLNRSINKIRGIINGTLCEVSMNVDGQPVSASKIAEEKAVCRKFLDDMLFSYGMTKCSGQINICYWDKPVQIYSFENSKVIL